ncbi:putative reverse transcriptase domain-containing protein [Tanacetum coccineum]|uniref:Reverse transcriptase domain-containing protein n=1 Tax=Tanacetum coccineum TaxID=301880 RepID=A0ABQ5DIU5_9ASTR
MLRSRTKHQRPIGFVVTTRDAPMKVGQTSSMDFVTKLPKSSQGYDTIWSRKPWNTCFSFICDRGHSVSIKFLESLQKVFGYKYGLSTAYHRERRTKRVRTIQTSRIATCLRIDFGMIGLKTFPLVEFSYNNSYHASIKAAPFEALYGRKCRSPMCWAEVGQVQLTNNYDNESSDDDNNDDDVEKDEEDEEEEEHLAPADLSAVPIDDPVPSS